MVLSMDLQHAGLLAPPRCRVREEEPPLLLPPNTGRASPSGIWKEALAKGMDKVLPPLHYLPRLWGQTVFLPTAHCLSCCPHPLPNRAHSALRPSSTSRPNSTWGGGEGVLTARHVQRIQSREQAYWQSASSLTMP